MSALNRQHVIVVGGRADRSRVLGPDQMTEYQSMDIGFCVRLGIGETTSEFRVRVVWSSLRASLRCMLPP